MSRRNNVRGPTSALTEFLKESGITPTTVARRARTRVVPQPVAGPSNTAPADDGDDGDDGDDNGTGENAEYASDNLDESENEHPAPKKRKLSKAAAAKLKAKEKAKGKGKGKGKAKKGDEDDDYEDDSNEEEEDAYTALSKMWKDRSKPPVGSFEECARCNKQFTVTKYTLAANPPPGYLCHVCAKASGADPFKKPAPPRKRKAPADKRTVVHFEERRFPSLASLCIQLVSRHINDVEALGDIGSLNLDEISKALAKNRSLTPENAPLFYDVANIKLTLYDATGLTPPALCTMASLNPNLTTLRLDYCGRMDCGVLESWCTGLPKLTRLELLGPFLVRVPAWVAFFKSHPQLQGFLIMQSPRFDLECMQALAENCRGLTELRLKEIGKMSDDFLEHIGTLDQLVSLDLSFPGNPEALSEEALISLMSAVCGNLTYLDLSNNVSLTDGFLYQGIKPFAKHLSSLILANAVGLTDAGVAEFFDTWKTGKAPESPLARLDLSRGHELGTKALTSLLGHSGKTLTCLNINGWKDVAESALKEIPERCPELKQLDISWCREVDDWIVKVVMEKCEKMKDLRIWGCQRVTGNCPRKRNVNIQGIHVI